MWNSIVSVPDHCLFIDFPTSCIGARRVLRLLIMLIIGDVFIVSVHDINEEVGK